MLCVCLLVPTAMAGELSLRIEPMQQSYIVAEPLFVNVALTNVTGADESVPADLSYGNQTITAEYRKGDDAWKSIDTGAVFEPSGSTVALSQGEQLARAQMLAFVYDKKGPLLDSPGTWQIRSTFHRFDRIDGDVTSDIVDVEVVAGGADDAAAAELFSNPKVLLLAHNVRESPAEMEVLETIIKEHADSRFAAYAKLFLAQRLLEPMVGREPDPRRAQSLLRELAGDRDAPSQIGQSVLRLSSLASTAVGDWQSAIDTSERLKKAAPSRDNQRLHDFVRNRQDAAAAQRFSDAQDGASSGGSRRGGLLTILALPALIAMALFWKFRRARTRT